MHEQDEDSFFDSDDMEEFADKGDLDDELDGESWRKSEAKRFRRLYLSGLAFCSVLTSSSLESLYLFL